jgi:hypothetical protein
MSHKFKVQQLVRRNGAKLVDSRTGSDVYEVVRLLPEDQAGEPGYRIRSGPIERAVREFEIAAAS